MSLKKVSEFPLKENISNDDIFYVSEKKNLTNTYSSKHTKYSNLVDNLRISFEDEINTLNDINDNYVA